MYKENIISTFCFIELFSTCVILVKRNCQLSCSFGNKTYPKFKKFEKILLICRSLFK